MSSTLDSNMRATTEALIDSFNGHWSVEATLAYRAPECQHAVLPSALNVAPRNNEQWAEYFSKIAPLVSEAKMTIEDYVAVPSERRVVCRSSMTADTPVGPFVNEYVWFLKFDSNGSKIVAITEFMDSLAATSILGKLAEAGHLPQH